MFKNKKVSLIIVSTLALTLAFGLVAFNLVDTASAAEIVGQGGFELNADFNGRRGGPGGDRDHGFGAQDTFLADALGITAEELQTAMQEVRSSFNGRVDKEELDAALADVLGITVDELTAACKEAKDAAIAQALAEGKITEEQVVMMEARESLKNYMEKDEILANVLGITVEDLEAAKEDGQRIPDLLEALDIDEETFQAEMQAAHKEVLQQAVEEGVITQEQADLILENGFDAPKGPGGPGHGRGGHGGFPGGKKPEGSRG